jgi:tetratricopeptide (TPR) repeat protein
MAFHEKIPGLTNAQCRRLLSGIALLHNNCVDGKAAQYLKQGLQSVHDSNKSRKATGPLPRTMAKSQWRDALSCYLLLYTVFCHALSSDWKAARDRLEVLDKSIAGLDDVSVGPLAHFHTYLSGICYQATGDLREAVKKFNDPMLQLSDRVLPSSRPEEQVQQELALLASLNTLWLQQADPNQDKSENAAMIAKLEPLCANHRNKDIETALKLVKATVKTEPATSGVKTKTYLASALDAARATSNKQFLCITLSVMCAKFFVGVVGVQADKAAKAAAHQAKRARNTLWMSVTHGMLANNLELQGNREEAKATNEEAKRLAALVFPGPS